MLFGFDDPLTEDDRADGDHGDEGSGSTAPSPSAADSDAAAPDRRSLRYLLIGLILGGALALATWALVADDDQALTQDDLDVAVAEAVEAAVPATLSAGQVFEQIAPSLIVVRAISDDPDAPVNIGAGVTINEQGQVLTSNHVIGGATTLEVQFPDGTATTATIDSQNPQLDMALLNPDGLFFRSPAVLGNPRTLSVGDTVYAVGNPLGLTGSLSSGVISGLNRDIPRPDTDDAFFEDLIQFDAAVNQGSSGGPLLNADGQVIGIVTALADPTGDGFFVGIGFAVPIDIAAAGAANGPSQ